MAIRNIANRARGYGIYGVSLDGTDVEGIAHEAQKACKRAREGEGPTLIEVRVPRLAAHSSDDDQRKYRSDHELSKEALRDPLAALERFLRVRGIVNDATEAALEQEIASGLLAAEQEAEQSPTPDPATIGENVYLKEGSDAANAS